MTIQVILICKSSLALRNSKDDLRSIGAGWFFKNFFKEEKATVVNYIAEAIKQWLETAQLYEYSMCIFHWPS